MPGPTRTERWLAFLSILINNCFAIFLICLRLSNWDGSPEAASWITRNRTLIGIVVQILSHTMGLALIQAICTILNLSTRVALRSAGVTLDRLKLTEIACSVRIDWSLGYKHLSIVCLWAILALVPGALWAGALTPVITSSHHTQNLTIASFDNTTGITLNHVGTEVRNSSWYKTTALGTFNFAPDLDLQNNILNLAQDVTNRTGGASDHPKLDKTGFTYIGRGYGIAASAGLRDSFNIAATSYQYEETGHLVETVCLRNNSSKYHLESVLSGEGWTVHIFDAVGLLPNGVERQTPAVAFSDDKALAMAATGQNGSNFVAFATADGENGTYNFLNNIQCQVVLRPTIFVVQVNQTEANRTINVVPQTTVGPLPYTSELERRVMQILGTFGSILSTAAIISVLGELLATNTLKVEASDGDGDDSTFKAVAMTLNSIMDSCLESISAAQIEVSNSTQMIEASTRSVAFKVGAFRYQVAVAALGLVIMVAFLEESTRTKLWTHATSLNFMDLKSVILATSAGGPDIAKRAVGRPIMDSNNAAQKHTGFKVVAQDRVAEHPILVMATETSDAISLDSLIPRP